MVIAPGHQGPEGQKGGVFATEMGLACSIVACVQNQDYLWLCSLLMRPGHVAGVQYLVRRSFYSRLYVCSKHPIRRQASF